MNNVVAIIVTFNPDIRRLEENLNAIVGQVDAAVIVDNGSENITDVQKLAIRFNSEIIVNEQNKGIATALNQGLQYASLHGFEYVLTLDQDSISSEKMVEELKKRFSEDENIAIIGPQIQELNIDAEVSHQSDELVYVNDLMTSGSLCEVAKLKSVGGFNDKLFIDCVDIEMCWRLRVNGYLIAKNNKVVIKHEIGKINKKRFLYRDVHVSNHNAVRAYYMARNKIYILRKYHKLTGVNVARELYYLCLRCSKIILYESDKLKKIINTVKGIKDGLFL